MIKIRLTYLKDTNYIINFLFSKFCLCILQNKIPILWLFLSMSCLSWTKLSWSGIPRYTENHWGPLVAGATDFLRTEGMVQGVSCLSLLTLLRRLHKVSFCAEHLAKEQSLPSFNSWVWRGQSTSKIRTHDLPDTKRRL